jgi:hypothetical protein
LEEFLNAKNALPSLSGEIALVKDFVMDWPLTLYIKNDWGKAPTVLELPGQTKLIGITVFCKKIFW